MFSCSGRRLQARESTTRLLPHTSSRLSPDQWFKPVSLCLAQHIRTPTTASIANQRSVIVPGAFKCEISLVTLTRYAWMRSRDRASGTPNAFPLARAQHHLIPLSSFLLSLWNTSLILPALDCADFRHHCLKSSP